MLDNYLIELADALIAVEASNVDDIVDEYRSKYHNIIKVGKSPFEAILALGDPMEIAARVKGIDYTAEEKLLSNMLDSTASINGSLRTSPIESDTTKSHNSDDSVSAPLAEDSIQHAADTDSLPDKTALKSDDSVSAPLAEDSIQHAADTDSLPDKTARKSSSSASQQPTKAPTAMSIVATDILYITPALILSIAGLIALAFLGGLSGFIGVKYAIICWTTFDTTVQKVCAFVLSIIAILLFVGAMVITILSVRKIVVGMRNYVLERKEKLAIIKANKAKQ